MKLTHGESQYRQSLADRLKTAEANLLAATAEYNRLVEKADQFTHSVVMRITVEIGHPNNADFMRFYEEWNNVKLVEIELPDTDHAQLLLDLPND